MATENTCMRALTHDGRYIAGSPDAMLRSLADHFGALGEDFRRVEHFRRTIGREFAAISARQILEGLDQEGLILLEAAPAGRAAR